MNNYKYNCLLCKYTTNSSQSWYQHTKAKKHLKNVKIAEQNNENTGETPENTGETPENTGETPENTGETPEQKSATPIQSLEKQNINFSCPYCKQYFTRSYTLNRHINERCKKNPKLEEKKKIKNEKKKLEEEEKKIELEKQKFMMQFIEKQAEEQRRIMEKQAEERRIEKEEQRKREEKQAEEQRKRDEQQSKLMEMILLSQNNKEGISLNIEDMYEKIEKMIDKKLQGGESKTDNSENHHNHNSGTIFEAKHQNNLLNNLNLNYTNVISMEKFLYNMEHVNKIPVSDLEAIAYASENMKEDDLAETLHKTIMKNCEEQTKGVINEDNGLEMIPVLPVVCSDGNCRSHKEKVNQFWETVYADNHFDKMLNIIDKRLYEVLKKKIYLEEYGKKKLFKKIKRKYTIHDMKSMQDKINGDKTGKIFKEI
jgi:hypothetical protein